VSQSAGTPVTLAVRFGLLLVAALAFAVTGIATGETITAAQGPDLQTTPVTQTSSSTSIQTTPVTTTSSSSDSNLATTPAPSGPAGPAVAAAATVMPAGTMTVAIRDFDFSPSNLNIHVGDTVVWMNNGPANHTATSASGMWDTGPLSTGQSSYFTFNQPGMFAYYCSIHPRMRGTVTVAPASPSARMSSGLMGFDGGYSMGFGPSGGYGQSNYGMSGPGYPMSYYYNPINGYYDAAAYPGYPYNLGYGFNNYVYGMPYTTSGGYGYGYPSSYYNQQYPYSYYGGGNYGPYTTTSLYGYPYSYGLYGGYPYYAYGQNPLGNYGYGSGLGGYGYGSGLLGGYGYGANAALNYPYSQVYGQLFSPSYYAYTGYNPLVSAGAQYGYPYTSPYYYNSIYSLAQSALYGYGSYPYNYSNYQGGYPYANYGGIYGGFPYNYANYYNMNPYTYNYGYGYPIY